jgi:hypothetical protein
MMDKIVHGHVSIVCLSAGILLFKNEFIDYANIFLGIVNLIFFIKCFYTK